MRKEKQNDNGPRADLRLDTLGNTPPISGKLRCYFPLIFMQKI